MNDATDRDGAREAEVIDVTGYNLTTKEAEQLFSDSGVPRSARTIQRYCKSGYLDCRDYPTENGMMLRINQSSVERRIEEIQQIQSTTEGRDMPRPAATPDGGTEPVVANDKADDMTDVSRQTAMAGDSESRRDMSGEGQQRHDTGDGGRQPATGETGRDMSPGVGDLVDALRQQLDVKDETIRSLREERDLIRKEREGDLEFYGNLRTFVYTQVEDLFEERNSLRQRVRQLESLLPAGASSENELPAGQASPLDFASDGDAADQGGVTQEAQAAAAHETAPESSHNGPQSGFGPQPDVSH